MASNTNEQLIRQAYQDFSTGNIEGILNVLSDNIRWESAGHSEIPIYGNFKGKNEVGNFFQNLDKYLEFLSFNPVDYLTSGNKVIVLGNSETRVRETGKNIKEDWAMIWEIDNGKINYYRLFDDTNATAIAFKK